MLDASQTIQMFGSLAAVLVLIYATTFILKRIDAFKPKGDGDLSIVSQLSLGAKEKLIIVEVGSEQLLLGITASQIKYLHKLEHPIPRPKKGQPPKAKS